MANSLNQTYEIVPVDQLVMHPNNPRIGDVEGIRESIRTNGFFGALVVQRGTNFVLVGSHRMKAAVAEGYTELPVFWMDVGDHEAKRIMLVDNRESDKAGNDSDVVLAILRELEPEGFEGTGFDAEAYSSLVEITAELAEGLDDDFSDLETPEEPTDAPEGSTEPEDAPEAETEARRVIKWLAVTLLGVPAELEDTLVHSEPFLALHRYLDPQPEVEGEAGEGAEGALAGRNDDSGVVTPLRPENAAEGPPEGSTEP